MRCLECGEARKKKLYEDPRDPRLEDGPCVCIDCYRQFIETFIDEAEENIENWKAELKKLRKE